MDHVRSSGLVGIPANTFPEIFSCVRCDCIPDPNYLMACDNGHYTCGDCAKSANQEVEAITGGERKEWSLQVRAVEPCCELKNLHKEPPHLLKSLLEQAMFRCRYHEKGCSHTMLGSENFFEHVRNCSFRPVYKCRHHQCTEKRSSVMELLEHYRKDHDGIVLKIIPNGQILLPVNFKETKEKRLCAILGFKNKHFIFATEIRDDILFMWIWDLGHDPQDEGNTTDVSYQLKLKTARGATKIEDPKNLEELGKFKGDCLSHSVQRYDIMRTSGSSVETFKMDVESFKRLFVFETVSGNGKWFVNVMLKEKDEKKN